MIGTRSKAFSHGKFRAYAGSSERQRLKAVLCKRPFFTDDLAESVRLKLSSAPAVLCSPRPGAEPGELGDLRARLIIVLILGGLALSRIKRFINKKMRTPDGQLPDTFVNCWDWRTQRPHKVRALLSNLACSAFCLVVIGPTL